MVRPGFQKDGVSVSQIGIKMYVTIPELGVQVMFSGLIFSVEVPFSKFANNTEGQCGESRPQRAPRMLGPFSAGGTELSLSMVGRVALGRPLGITFLAGAEAARVAPSLQLLLLHRGRAVCTPEGPKRGPHA